METGLILLGGIFLVGVLTGVSLAHRPDGSLHVIYPPQPQAEERPSGCGPAVTLIVGVSMMAGAVIFLALLSNIW